LDLPKVTIKSPVEDVADIVDCSVDS